MNRYRFILIPLILLLAAVCGFIALRLSSASGAVPAEIVTVQPTATPTRTSMPTATATPTATPEPTATATPTPAPITLPVTNGTPIPDLPYEVITAENVHRLRQVARYGYPRLLEANPYRLTADGKTIVVGTTLGLEFYDAQTQEKTGALEVEFLRDYDLTPDGQYLLTFAGEKLTVWQQDGTVVRAFDLPIGDAWALNPVALSPDGTLVAVQRKKADWQEADKVDVYRVADGSLVDTVRGMGAVFSPDGQYLATVFDGSVRLYPVAELGQGWEKRLPKQSLPWCGATEGNCGLVFSPDGTLAAVVRAARVDVYQAAERKLVRQVSGWEAQGTYYLPQVQVAEGRLLVTTLPVYDSQGKVQTPAQAIVVDIASGEWVSKSEVESGFAYLDAGQVRMFQYSLEKKDLNLLGIKDDGQVLLSDESCQVVDNRLSCYSLMRDGADWVLSDHDKTVLKFQSLGEDRVKTWIFFGNIVVNHVWLGQNGVQAGKLRIYNPEGVMIVEISGLAFFANATNSGTIAVLCFDDVGQSKIVVIKPGEKPRFLLYPGFEALMMGITDDELVTFGSKEIVFWNSDGFSKIKGISHHILTDTKAWVRISPDGAMLFFSIGSLENGFNIIDLDADEPKIVPIMREIGTVGALHISPNGRLFATYGEDGFIRVWAVVPEGANVR